MKCLHTCFSRIKSLAITLAMPQVFKYQQPNLFLVRWCTVHVARRGWLQRHIIIHHQSAELWGTILLRSGPSARYALVPSEYVPVYAVSTLLRISRDVVRLETLRLKEILIVFKNKKKRNLFSKQLRYNWKKISVLSHEHWLYQRRTWDETFSVVLITLWEYLLRLKEILIVVKNKKKKKLVQ